jgi:hypothetical protein
MAMLADALVMDKGQAPNDYSLYDFFNFGQAARATAKRFCSPPNMTVLRLPRSTDIQCA